MRGCSRPTFPVTASSRPAAVSGATADARASSVRCSRPRASPVSGGRVRDFSRVRWRARSREPLEPPEPLDSSVLRVKQRPTPSLPSNELTVHRPDRDAADLVARCQAGDVDAFAELYRQHAPRVFRARLPDGAVRQRRARICCRRSSSRRTGRFVGSRAISTVGTWLYRLAINHCLDFVRSRRVKMDKATDSLDDGRFDSAGAAHDSPVERIDLERAIRQLPPGCREAFVLHDVEGYEHQRDRRRCSASPRGTSKSQVFKARLKLRAVLA